MKSAMLKRLEASIPLTKKRSSSESWTQHSPPCGKKLEETHRAEARRQRIMKKLLDRLKAMERQIFAKLPFWPDDSDQFMEALGVDASRYEKVNADGSTGFDYIAALADTAAEDWRDIDFIDGGDNNDGKREKS